MNVTSRAVNSELNPQIGWEDYLSFCFTLVLSGVIGIYFGIWGNKEDTKREFLHGGKTMRIWPVAASLVVSMISPVAVLGNPTEVYMYGTLIWLLVLSCVFTVLIVDFLFLPVFYELQLTSSFEYLELRFNRSVRIMASVLSTINTVLYMPIVIYIPALALSQVTGLHLHYIAPLICIVCILYTVIGGIKAVVWTDFLQALILIGSLLTIMVLGIKHVGGYQTIWERNYNGGRIRIFEMDPSPFKRLTFWTSTIGMITQCMYLTTNQPSVQRYISLPTLSSARKSLYIFYLGIVIILSLTYFTGLLLYAEYHDCDPLKSKKISKADQMTTYYVMSISKYTPGLPGLFLAGVVSASLSSLSSYLNSLGATVFEDFVSPWISNEMSDKSANNIIKLIVVIFGFICLAMVFVVEKLGLVVQLCYSFIGVTGGAIVALFSFGMFYPRGNYKGVLAGSIASLLIMAWIVFGSQKAIMEGRLKHQTLPTTAEGCGYNDTSEEELPVSSNTNNEDVFILYRTSFSILTTFGYIIVFIVGIPISIFTSPQTRQQMNLALFSPMVRKYITKRSNKYQLCKTNEFELLSVDK